MNQPNAKFAAVQERTPDVIVTEWRTKQAELERVKAEELALRNEVLRGAFNFQPGATGGRKGTEYFDMQGGFRLKAVFKLNYKVNPDTIDGILTKIEKTGAEGKFLAERLVKFEPKLSVSEYGKLGDESKVKKLIDEALTISDGTPSLEFVEPKAK